MAEYGSIDTAKAGMIDGLFKVIDTLSVEEDASFEFGDPVFVAENVANIAKMGDATNTDLIFAGIAIISQRSFTDEQGEYPEHDPMNVLNYGTVWVKVESSLAATDIIYSDAYVIVDTTDADYGKFTTDNTHYSTDGRFRSNPVAVGDDYLALVEIRGMASDTIAT
jgi:hypothetical protein